MSVTNTKNFKPKVVFCKDCGEMIRFVDEAYLPHIRVMCEELGYFPTRADIRKFALCKECANETVSLRQPEGFGYRSKAYPYAMNRRFVAARAAEIAARKDRELHIVINGRGELRKAG